MKLSITTSCVFSCVLSAAMLSNVQHIAAHPERAVTMWWVLFNKPSACTTNPDGPVKCGIPDIMGNAQGGTNDQKIAIINASGGVSDSTGFLRLAAALYKTDSCALDLEADNGQYVWGGPPVLYDGSSLGYCPAEGEVTEVHIVMRDHGHVTADKLKQLTTFTDPSCSQVGGSNLCVDIGAVGFSPMSEDGLMTKDIGHFPKFPPGCADAEVDPCEEEVEEVQLMTGMGNMVTLVQTGDALQVVAEITVPYGAGDPNDMPMPMPMSMEGAERAITMWWVLFNKPSACTTNPDGPVKCGVPDIMGNAQGGTNDPKIAIINASGGVSDGTGFLRLAAALYKTDSCALDLEADNSQYVWGGPAALYDGSSFGYCPADGEVTEVHIVMRDHGPVTADKLKQLTTFTDPSCSQAGGSNLCVDIGAVGFPSMSEDGVMTKDIGHFPKFPPGCAAAEVDPCPENVEMIQLMAGMGNEVTVVRTGDALQVVAEITVPAVQEDPIDYIPNPQQTDRTERPCLADCIQKENCYDKCEVVCTPPEPPAVGEWTIFQNSYSNGFAGDVFQVFTTLAEAQAKCLELGTSVCRAVTCGIDANFGTNGCTVRESAQLDPSLTGETSYVPSTELCEEVCEPVCQIGEVCTFEVGRDELSSELGYYEFKGDGGATCPGTNPVLGIKKGATYLFTQRRTGNYYHPLGFAYAADGALDDQPELEPGICPGTVKGEEDTTECDCKEMGLCPAPMYYTSNNYLGAYSNNPYLAPINGESDDFGLDAYEPQFFYPLLQWKGTPREEDPEGPGYYQVALHFPEDEEYTGDFFYFCHIHQFMTGRFKFVDEVGLSISPDNTLRIPYEYQEPDAYDRSCGATGISESQLPDMECPTTFVCDAPDAAVAPFAAKFAECVDSMNCAMLKGITTKISSDSPIALFNHQMIPHHQQAVNMCKALDVAQGTECEDIFDEDEPKCVLKVLCQEIINVQNAQIQTMRGILQQLELPDTDNCIVDIPVDPQTACEAQSEITGYTWCVLTQTCVPPGDDACLEAECEENSIVTGKHWCALMQTCFEQGDQSCDKAYCELDSENTGYTWCELTGTCVAPGDDACLEAECEENSVSTGYHWCALTQICFPPGDRECDKAYCELESESTGFSWCDLLEKCLPPTEDCVLPTGPPAPTDAPVATSAPTVMPTLSRSSKSSKSSKSRRHTRQLKYE